MTKNTYFYSDRCVHVYCIYTYKQRYICIQCTCLACELHAPIQIKNQNEKSNDTKQRKKKINWEGANNFIYRRMFVSFEHSYFHFVVLFECKCVSVCVSLCTVCEATWAQSTSTKNAMQNKGNIFVCYTNG